MSIPIDKLYHYIEGIAREIRGDDIIIYRFYPHGSKKLEDLSMLRGHSDIAIATQQQLYCYDQEPLDYDRYANLPHPFPKTQEIIKKYNIDMPFDGHNLCINRFHVYDSHIIIHSEQRSKNLDKYTQDKYFVPVYYWSHAIIARDWFRYAIRDTFIKNIQKTFLIYNRAWSGTREYRLKFMDLLIENDLVNSSQVTLNPIEPELHIHYKDYQFTNQQMAPVHQLEEYVTNITTANSSSSADYCREDYEATEFEVVLETLFDDDRLQLTEKALRPIAVGQPFLLVATHGSLKYLQSYGFKTFNGIVDESYDTIEDPVSRLKAVVKSMKEITSWTEQERIEKMALINQIVVYNRQHFFSNEFTNQVEHELYTNLAAGIVTVESTNTGKRFIDRRKKLAPYKEFKNVLVSKNRKTLSKILQRAREYYNKH